MDQEKLYSLAVFLCLADSLQNDVRTKVEQGDNPIILLWSSACLYYMIRMPHLYLALPTSFDEKFLQTCC